MTLNKLLVGIIYISLAIAVALALSCSKPVEDQRCYFACLISDKYTKDSVFVVRDTLWIQPCLTKYWFDKEKEAALTADGMFLHCNPLVRNGKIISLEIWTHVFDRNKVTYPKVF